MEGRGGEGGGVTWSNSRHKTVGCGSRGAREGGLVVYLVKELFSGRVWLDVELQLRVHSGDAHIHLQTARPTCIVVHTCRPPTPIYPHSYRQTQQ